MIMSGEKENSLYKSLMELSNIVQPVFDEIGYADQALVVAKKIN